ncbi:MAG: HAAS signaling domain-containing protein [Caulobacter sp.]
MTLLDTYLKAVGAQLPKASRDDIVAELRDMIMTRFETREEALGRALTEAEQEAILREIGHPLAVAGRYHTGANNIVGLELYPYWLFAAKIGLAALAAICVLAGLVQLLVGDASLPQAFGRVIGNFIQGALTLVGVLTIAGFIIERQAEKPKFITDWRVKDLHLFELGSLDTGAIERSLTGGSGGKKSGWAPRANVRINLHQTSPTANALGAAVGFTILLLWWTGMLPIADLRPGAGSWVVDGVDYGLMVTRIVEIAFWPILAYLGARIGLELFRAWRPAATRRYALGQMALAAVRMWGLIWLWAASALSPVIRVDTLQDLHDRARSLIHGHFDLGHLITMIVVALMIETVLAFLGSLWRLATPAPRETAATA